MSEESKNPDAVGPRKQPDEAELKVLRNLARGAPFEEGFVVEQNALRAAWQCLLAGWMDRGRLTPAGRAVLVEAAFRCAPILLPPSSLGKVEGS